MNLDRLRGLLEDLQRGSIEVDQVLERLKVLPFDDLPFARLDTHRLLRTGLEEVIYAPGKLPEQMEALVRRSLEHHGAVLATRVAPELAAALRERFPQLGYSPLARTLCYRAGRPPFPGAGQVAVVTAGTADIPVAEEAAVTLEFLGSSVERVTDVGVAGIHRLFDKLELLRRMSVLVVVAGMDGALPGVIAGLLDRPVVAVPTSVGAGAHLGGLAPLLTMLNTCAPGVSVVNIDNGFGAACVAHRINRVRTTASESRHEGAGDGAGDEAGEGMAQDSFEPDGARGDVSGTATGTEEGGR